MNPETLDLLSEPVPVRLSEIADDEVVALTGEQLHVLFQDAYDLGARAALDWLRRRRVRNWWRWRSVASQINFLDEVIAQGQAERAERQQAFLDKTTQPEPEPDQPDEQEDQS